MIWILAACALGLPAGILLLWRVPLCPGDGLPRSISIVIPARNEERNLPRLLESAQQLDGPPSEIVVIDDDSTDATASIASQYGARVIPSLPLPEGWTGKTWACTQGAEAARSPWLLYLDADTYFEPSGFKKFAACGNRTSDENCVISLLPYHVTKDLYEQVSVFFNLLMAFGAGGFGTVGKGRLFGQCLLISRDLYARSGGHGGVRKSILENFALAENIKTAGGTCMRFGGRGVLNIRMFPDGLAQLCESWTKAFADGAAASEPTILWLAIFWLTTLCADFLLVVFAPGAVRVASAVLYSLFVIQVAWLARQIGNYRLLTCLLYPLPLIFFFVIFALSLYRRVFKRKVMWRGRSL